MIVIWPWNLFTCTITSCTCIIHNWNIIRYYGNLNEVQNTRKASKCHCSAFHQSLRHCGVSGRFRFSSTHCLSKIGPSSCPWSVLQCLGFRWYLSPGNQQCLMLSSWFCRKCKVGGHSADRSSRLGGNCKGPTLWTLGSRALSRPSKIPGRSPFGVSVLIVLAHSTNLMPLLSVTRQGLWAVKLSRSLLADVVICGVPHGLLLDGAGDGVEASDSLSALWRRHTSQGLPELFLSTRKVILLPSWAMTRWHVSVNWMCAILCHSQGL